MEEPLRLKEENMIDRVAMAMVHPASQCWRLSTDEVKEELRRMARAAIEAMREPTAAMLRDGRDAIDDGETYGCEFKAGEAYRTMIQSALQAEGGS